MITLEDTLARLSDELDRDTLETYVAHAWVRPVRKQEGWRFEEIDIARIRLVRHLQRDMLVDDNGMDVVLHLLDQMYEMHRRLEAARHHEINASAAEFWEEREEF